MSAASPGAVPAPSLLRVGVVGLGLIGGSLLRRLHREPGIEVAGWDAAAEVVEAVRERGYGIAASLGELAVEADLVMVAVPPRNAGPTVVAALEAGARAACDVASVKAPVQAWVTARAGPAAVRYVAAHPLAGGEASGWAAASPSLLNDAVWAVCPDVEGPEAAALDRFGRTADALGARLLFCTAEEHDEATARSSHAPHVVAQALAAVAAELPLAGALAGRALREMTRTAGSDPALWSQILLLNDRAALSSLDAILETLSHLRGVLAARDERGLAAAWRSGATARSQIVRANGAHTAWRPRTLAWPPWETLLALGRDGRLVRGLRLQEADELSCEVAEG